MRFRHSKQFFVLALAGALTVGSVGVPLMTANAGEIVAFEKTVRGASMETGMSYSADEMNTTFNGTNVFQPSAVDVGLFRDNIKGASSIDISITFKVTNAETNFIKLLELCDSKNNANGASQPQSTLGIIVSTAGVVYLEAGSYATGTDWQAVTNKRIDDGKSHTLQISISGNGMTAQMDGGAQVSVNGTGSKNTKSFVQAFFGASGTSYRDWRQEMDCVVIGGMSANSYFNHQNYSNLNGEITSITIAGQNSAETPVGGGVTSAMFASDSLDNTWMFGGGVETQGRYEEIGGVRNFIGQFEEYVRWSKRVNGVREGMQRYTINAGREGQDAAAFAEKLPELITKVDPMAVSYLIGPEDYNRDGDVEAFKAALGTIIDTALAMKSGNGCVVIQYPHAVQDEALNTKIEAYRSAAQQVVQGRSASEKEHIAVVDHYAQTNTEDFKNNKLTEEGLLNAAGHYEIARQFSQVVYGSVDNTFPTISETWTAQESPETYLDRMPEVTASADSLKVKIDGMDETKWRYILNIDGAEIRGTASGNPFTIEKLPAGKEYELTVQTGDGKTQLSIAAGTVTEGNRAQAPALTEMQQAIRSKAEDMSEPLTWLFMGDSITHAAAHTHGYDGVAQIFEKYLKEDLGRTDDLVVNTAVSGATAERTIENIEQRMTKYKPDIVSIMLGTNDTINESLYNNNLKRIVEKIREVNPEALIIFRSPTPAKSGAYATKPAGESGSVAQMKKVAQECGNILFIDQYTEWSKETAAYSYLFTSAYYYGDNNIHPGAAGQLRMAQQFIKECGLNRNGKIAGLSYLFNYAEETNTTVKPTVTIADTKDAITVSKSDLNTKYTAGDIGEMTVILTDREGTTFTKTAGLDDTEVTIALPASRNYTVKAVANIKGGTAKHVTFTGDDLLLATGTEKEDLQSELSAQQVKFESNLSGYTPASVQAFQAAYEAAQKALTDSKDDPEALDRCMAALAKSAAALQEKTVVKGMQTVSIEGNAVVLPADASYTASDVTWNAEKTGGSFILTAKEDARFDSKVQMSIANAAALQIEKVNTAVEDNKITVTFTVKVKADSDNQGQNIKPGIPDQPIQVIVAGKTYDDGKYSYKVLSTTDMTAEVTGIKDTAIKKVVVANSVKLGGKDYKVVSVAANAFKGNKKITSVSVKKNVKAIGKNAFAGCIKLKKVTISSTKLTTINAKAFSGCKSLKAITIKSKVLKKVGKNTFKGIHKKAVIKVPKAKLAAYKSRVLKNKGQAKSVKIK